MRNIFDSTSKAKKENFISGIYNNKRYINCSAHEFNAFCLWFIVFCKSKKIWSARKLRLRREVNGVGVGVKQSAPLPQLTLLTPRFLAHRAGAKYCRHNIIVLQNFVRMKRGVCVCARVCACAWVGVRTVRVWILFMLFVVFNQIYK